jgi:hypothetical protein
MRLTILVVAVAVALGAAPGFSAAQSLAEVAAKEKERRKGTSGKVITESDLRSAGHGTQSFESEGTSEGDATASADGAPAAEGVAGEKAAGEKAAGSTGKSEDKRADRQAALQKEIDAERTHIEGMKKDIATREVELNDPTFAGDSQVNSRRTALLKYVDDAKAAITTHEAQIEKLLGQARSEGIPIR